jgi:hypothetical protein
MSAAAARFARDTRQRAFVALLPSIESLARSAFRGLRCPHDRADAAAEVVARAWERFRRAPRPHAVAAGRLARAAVAEVRAALTPAPEVGRLDPLGPDPSFPTPKSEEDAA